MRIPSIADGKGLAGWAAVAVVAVVLAASAVYTVPEGHVGVVKRFQ